MSRRPAAYHLSADAQILQAVISPGEVIDSMRELAFRAFGDTSPTSHARTFRAAIRLADMGRIRVETDGRSIIRLISLDTPHLGFQLAAVIHRFVSASLAI